MKQVIKTTGAFLAICFLLASCSRSPESTSTQYSPTQIAGAIISAQAENMQLEPLFTEDDYFTDYVSDIYRLNADDIKDGAIYYARGARANEIAVFLLNSGEAADDAKDSLLNYKERRRDTFMGYAPEQAAMLENGIVVSHGDYIAILICDDPQTAQSTFAECFTEQPPIIDYDRLESILPKNSSAQADADDTKSGENGNYDFYMQTGDEDWESEAVREDNGAGDTSSGGISEGSADDSASLAAEINHDGDAAKANPDIIDADNINTEFINSDNTDSSTQNADNMSADSSYATSVDTTGDDMDRFGSSEGEGNGRDSSDNIGSATNENTQNDLESNSIETAAGEHGDETPAPDDYYDPAAILRAWRSGDMDGLTYKNRQILEACIEIIYANTSENMSDYEKELAIHDWIIDWVSYDQESMSNSPNARPEPDNNNPYGAIFHRKSICSGYTSTFQLLMDMLGIECITVNGRYVLTGEVHAWNMVKMDGEWYCVDVTWNDPIGGNQTSATRHRFFNVTTEFMRDTGHQWDESSTPIADAGKLYYG